MGSSRIVLLPGELMICMQKPDACGSFIRVFLDTSDAIDPRFPVPGLFFSKKNDGRRSD